MTEIQNAVNLLITNGYLIEGVSANGASVSVSGKLNREYRLMLDKVMKPAQSTVLFQTEHITIRKFRELAEIPTQIKTKNFTFNVSRISSVAEKYFNSKVVNKVNMDKLVAATKDYYANQQAARVTLTNYFMEGVWESVYQDYIKQPTVAKPTFTGERSL